MVPPTKFPSFQRRLKFRLEDREIFGAVAVDIDCIVEDLEVQGRDKDLMRRTWRTDGMRRTL
jgi:hypothetical protein